MKVNSYNHVKSDNLSAHLNRNNEEGFSGSLSLSGARLTLAVLLVLGLVARMYGAWSVRHHTHSDYGIVGLMSKHIMEGKHFPLLFYRQPYLGTLEAMVGSVACRLFGCTMFSVALGTALIGFGLLPLLFVWGRDAWNRTAGLVACLLAVIGTIPYFLFMAAPTCGYVLTLTLGVLVLWLAAAAEVRGDGVRGSVFALMGFAAGLAWWTNPLSVTFLAPAALVLAVRLRGRCVNRHTGVALLGFLLGSLPWWVFLLGSADSSAFAHAASVGRADLGNTWQRMVARGEPLLGLDRGSAWLRWAQAGSYVVLLLGYVFALGDGWLRRRQGGFRASALCPMLVALWTATLMLSSVYFERSGTVRYLLPLWPALVVMLGMGAAFFHARLGPARFVAFVPVCILLFGQCETLRWSRRAAVAERARWQSAEAVLRFGREQGIDAWRGDYSDTHWLSFATGERAPVCSYPHFDRYRPYRATAALGTNVGVLDGYYGFDGFLAQTRGRARCADVGVFTVTFDVVPDDTPWRYGSSEELRIVEQRTGRDVTEILCDMNVESVWQPSTTGLEEETSLVVELGAMTEVCGVRVPNVRWRRSVIVRISGRAADGQPWVTLLDEVRVPRYFWSGAQFYPRGLLYVREYRFAPARVTQLRLDCVGGAGRERTLPELAVMVAGGDAAPEWDARTLVQACRAGGVDRLYAPRCVSEALSAGAELRTVIPDGCYEQYNGLDRVLPHDHPRVSLSRDTGFLCRPQDAARTGECLRRQGAAMRMTRVEGWVLFHFSNGTDSNTIPRFSDMCWTEWGAYLLSPARTAKRRAHEAFGLAHGESANRGAGSRAVPLLRKTLAFYPRYAPALAALAEQFEGMGQSGQGADVRLRLRRQTVPLLPMEVRYSGGLEFLGLTVSDTEVCRGGSLGIEHFWRCPPDMDVSALRVFVHFRRGAARFQDDHDLLGDIMREDLRFQPFDEVFVTSRTVRAPDTLPCGVYEVIVGLCRKSSGKRLRPRTAQLTSARAVHTGLMITVSAK